MKKSALSTRQLLAVTVVLFLFVLSCSKEPSVPNNNLSTNEASRFGNITDITAPSPFNKNVGAPIDGVKGDAWIANYKKKYGSTKYYNLNSGYLQAILNDKNCVGICLYYAKDLNFKVHILPVGVTATGNAIKSPSIPIDNGIVVWEDAKKWIFGYGGTVAGHFFGRITFDERLYLSYCKTIHVDFAIDDKSKPVLLLTNPCELNFGKKYEDDTFPCNTTSPSL